MATRTESPEIQTVRGKFAVICGSISAPDVVKYAGELLQSNLISDAGHQAAIAVTGLSPTNKIAHLVSEAANNVCNSPENFYKFVSIVESRNAQLASTLRSQYMQHVEPASIPDHEQVPDPTYAECVSSLRQVYRTAEPPTWDPLAQCQHVKLAMIKEKGKRCGSDNTIAESRVEGDVDILLTIKVPVDSDRIFDAGIFDNERQVILVEGVGGMGKTSLAYQYAKKWAEEKLSTFDAVALVRLRDLNEHDVREVDLILPHLLFLASGNSISKEMARLIVDKQKILLILDGWDEAPASIRKASFIKDLLRSVSNQSRILVTSRPDFSLDLHGLANRVVILGFTKDDIHIYFENALKSHLPNNEVKSACDKLSNHFHRYPVIESCCYVPLNAAILAYIYLNRDQTLPITRCDLFQELVLCCIVRELETRQPNRVLETVSSFEDLPADLKEQLHKLSELAFNGVMQNKIVFTQKELTSLSTLGLLHSVQGFGSIGRKLVTCNFIHLAVQELLAAYYISRLEPAEHSNRFETLLNDNLKFPVLQFYSGLTRLTNESVRNLIAGFNFNLYVVSVFNFDQYGEKSKHCFLAFLNCIFEAQIHDQSFYEQLLHTLKSSVDLSSISLSPMDCLSVHYFLSSIRTLAKGKINLDISICSIDDQCLGMLLGISTEHAETSSTSGVLESVETLEVQGNKYTDTGIAYITRALISNNTLKTLWVGTESVTDVGLVPLLEALPRQRSLKELTLQWTLSHPGESLKMIGECVGRSTMEKIVLFLYPPSLQSEEAVKEWVQGIVVGGNSLIHSLMSCQVTRLTIYVVHRMSLFAFDRNDIKTQLDSSLQESVTFINSERRKNSVFTNPLHLYVSCFL